MDVKGANKRSNSKARGPKPRQIALKNTPNYKEDTKNLLDWGEDDDGEEEEEDTNECIISTAAKKCVQSQPSLLWYSSILAADSS